MIFKLSAVLVFLTLVKSGNLQEARTFDMFGKLKSGLEMAGKFLGIDRAKGVAELVSDAFRKTDNRKGDDANSEGGNIFSGFLRMLGFDAKRIGALAINSIVFVAKMISKSLARSPSFLTGEMKDIPDGTPLDWVREKPEVKSQMGYITNPELPRDIVEYIKERSLDENTDCIQLLLCKTSPFIWGMQRSLTGENSTINGIDALFQYLPSTQEFLENSDKCEKEHPFCLLY